MKWLKEMLNVTGAGTILFIPIRKRLKLSSSPKLLLLLLLLLLLFPVGKLFRLVCQLSKSINNFASDNVACTTPEICNLFRNHFKNVFTDETLNGAEISAAVSNVPLRDTIAPHPLITPAAVEFACSSLKCSTNPGPDGIPSIILKKCSTMMSPALAHIFQLSLRSGVFPNVWKESYVFPVHKKGNKSDVSNYRGIAALCAASKLFELVVLEYFTHNCSSYISDTQHGFMPKRSTSSNLVVYSTYIFNALQARHQVDAIYTDLSAAFDKINHRIAIAKFSRLGICGTMLRWLETYLSGRSMSVKIGDHTSKPFRVTSGVPQGSHLGPFIFLLYLNDVNFALRCMHISYADDFKLYFTIRTPKDAEFLQLQLDAFSNWCRENRMVLNATKCSIISFTRKHSTFFYDYHIQGTPLTRVSVVKDLGVMFDQQLSFKDHISYIVTKASRCLGFLFRITKHFRDIQCLKVLFCALVRSNLEYCSVVWNPRYNNSIDRIEKIQRKFIRFALRNLPWNDPVNLPAYENRCNLIGLQTLSSRRALSDASFISDIILGHIDCSQILELVNFNSRPRNLRSQSFLVVPHASTNYGQNAPLIRTIRTFNRVSSEFDFHISRNTLKCKFRRALS